MKKSILLAALFVCGSIAFVSCDEEQPVAQSNVALDKHGCIDITYKTVRTDSCDILTVTRNVYDDNANLVKTITSADTLPLLHKVQDTLNTGRTYQDENGDDQEVDTIITHPATYQLYITVK